MGVSLSTIQRAEAGKRVSAYVRRKICDFFGEEYHRPVDPLELGLVYEKRYEGNKERHVERRRSGQDTQHEASDLFQLATLNPMVTTRHYNITRKMIVEAESRTKDLWRYLPPIANVVDEGFLIFVDENLKLLRLLLGKSPGLSIDMRLYSSYSETAQIAGTLLYSLKRHAEAEIFFRIAIEYAQKASNQALRAVALGRIGNFLIDTGRANEALDPLEDANRIAKGCTTPTVCSWLVASEADALASIGQASACDKALGGAEDLASQMSPGQDLYFTLFDAPWLNGYKGACYGRLGRTHDVSGAQTALKQALEHLDPTSIFRQSSLLKDLALAYSLERNIDEACRCGHQAINRAEQTHAPMELQHIQNFSQRYLKPWKDNRTVKNLNDRLWSVRSKLD